MGPYLHLDDACEDCGALAGVLCRNDCPTGPTFDDWHGHADATQPDELVPPGW